MAHGRPCCLLLAVACTLLCISSTRASDFIVTDQIFFDVSIDGGPTDRIVLGLFGKVAPKTVRNFMAFATEGVDGYSYKGTIFHRVIKKFMIQGGDVINRDGTGSLSLYGESFDDETFKIKHSAPGMLSMANSGKNTNGCQFFITTLPTPWLDNIHVAFGKVVQGMAMVHRIENLPTDSDDRPIKPVVIKDAGVLPTPEPFAVSDQPYDVWEWIRGASIPLAFSFSILAFFQWMIRQLDLAVEQPSSGAAEKSKVPQPPSLLRQMSIDKESAESAAEGDDMSVTTSDDSSSVRKRKPHKARGSRRDGDRN